MIFLRGKGGRDVGAVISRAKFATVPKPSDFAIAVAKWMRARAAVAQCGDAKREERISAAVDALARAEWKLPSSLKS